MTDNNGSTFPGLTPPCRLDLSGHSGFGGPGSHPGPRLDIVGIPRPFTAPPAPTRWEMEAVGIDPDAPTPGQVVPEPMRYWDGHIWRLMATGQTCSESGARPE